MSSFFFADADALPDADGIADGIDDANEPAEADILILFALEDFVELEPDDELLEPPPLPCSQATIGSDRTAKTATMKELRTDVFS